MYECMYVLPKALYDAAINSGSIGLQKSLQSKAFQQLNQIDVQDGGNVFVRKDDTYKEIRDKKELESTKKTGDEVNEINDYEMKDNVIDLADVQEKLKNYHKGESQRKDSAVQAVPPSNDGFTQTPSNVPQISKATQSDFNPVKKSFGVQANEGIGKTQKSIQTDLHPKTNSFGNQTEQNRSIRQTGTQTLMRSQIDQSVQASEDDEKLIMSNNKEFDSEMIENSGDDPLWWDMHDMLDAKPGNDIFKNEDVSLSTWKSKIKNVKKNAGSRSKIQPYAVRGSPAWITSKKETKKVVQVKKRPASNKRKRQREKEDVIIAKSKEPSEKIIKES